jgi:hypothetical protein
VRQTAPGRKPSGERFQGKGTIDAIRADEISMTTTDGQSLKLKISKKGKVHVIGSLTPEDLQKGKNVLFNAVIDKKTRRVKEPIKKLTIFTPSKDQPAGLFPDTAATTGAGDETIDLSAHWTAYVVAGSIQAIAQQKLTVNVPGLNPRFKVTLADGFQVDVNATDLSRVKAGDTIEVKRAFKADDNVVHVVEATIHVASPKRPKSE